MKTIAEIIKSELKEGYELVAVDNHKASTYYYITNPGGIKLVARTSDHDAICAASKVHVQVICDTLLHIDFEFDPVFDEFDNEIELTKKEAAKQLSNFFGIEIIENMIYEYSDLCIKMDWEKMDWEKMDIIIGKYIAKKITECNPLIIF